MPKPDPTGSPSRARPAHVLARKTAKPSKTKPFPPKTTKSKVDPLSGAIVVWFNRPNMPATIREAISGIDVTNPGRVVCVWHVPEPLAKVYASTTWPPYLNVPSTDESQWRFHIPAMGFASYRIPHPDGGALVVYTEA